MKPTNHFWADLEYILDLKLAMIFIAIEARGERLTGMVINL